MAQTKRKRRTKHRGNAAGSIEARGRTGRKPTAQEVKKTAARDRRAKPPSWRSAGIKAVAMAAVLFVLTQVHILGKNTSVPQGLELAVFAFVLYTPLAYFTDRAVYRRMLRRQQQGKS
jgi:hypothetical protein